MEERLQSYKKDTIDSLSDLFLAWMGGEPDSHAEVRDFVNNSKLKWLLDVSDVDAIIRNIAYFPDFAVKTVYNAIPLKFKTAKGEITIGPEEFNKFNYKVQNADYSTVCLNLSMKILNELKKDIGDDKKILIKREKNRLKMAQYRAEHPEYRKQENKRDYERRGGANMTEERREQLEKAKQKYADTHKKEISKRAAVKRLKMKEENPELLKQLDYEKNHAENRKEIRKRYRERNRVELRERARNNPKEKEWSKRYKAKVRFRTKTGHKILSLLEAITKFKER